MLPHSFLALAVATGAALAPADLRPIVARAALVSGSTELAPLATRESAPLARIVLDDGGVLEFEGGKACWKGGGAAPVELPLPAFEELALLGRCAASVHVGDAHAPQKVWRFDAATHTARPLAQLQRPEYQHERPIAIVERGGATYAMLAPWDADVVEWGPPGPPFRLVAWNSEGAELWSLFLGAGVQQPLPGAFLLAARGPVASGAAPVVLQADGNTVLASASGGAELLRVDASGKVLAKLERVWEFERGFIGPSVWSHYLARFGLEDYDAREPAVPEKLAQDAAYTQALERFRANEGAFVCGGPVVVGERVFVAVAEARSSPWSSYLGHGRVYELDHDLHPIGVVDLPSVPIGTLAVAHDGAVVWALPHDGFVRIPTTPQTELWGMGPGGWDCVPHVEWLREALPVKREPWLGTDPASSGVLFADGFALLTSEGGFVADEQAHVFRFPLRRVRLADGLEHALELRVPFEGELKLPATNFSSVGKRVHTFGPYGLGLTGLERAGPRLIARLGTETAFWELEFDLARALAD